MKIGKNAQENRKKIEGARIGVLGAARSGIAVSRLLRHHGASILLSDIKPAEKLKNVRQKLSKEGIELETGGHSDRLLQCDMICISPGMPVDIDILKRAAERSIPIVGEIEVASWFCISPIFAVTGSNGKTTTTTLTGNILGKWNPSTVVAGNIGIPFSEHVMNCTKKHAVVLEISSFQLETIHSFHPSIAAIMNLTPNHLDRYP
ncbi:MAG: UDP-N-acetylmuramoyl-L-alanine--D-glutamate ligase, partial [Calditrichaeota bacterium]|nr:UDP-N-acetylmuramoyl-L-alanine--D-glutamate ligase [Calditrichota bacterium]